MRSRTANPLMAIVNTIWASNLFQMDARFEKEGPDLESPTRYTELKFGEKDGNWTLVGEKQISYGKLEKPCFLVLGLHFFHAPLRYFKNFTLNTFENNVHSRALWIAPWEYVESLPIREGKRNCYVYPRLSDLDITAKCVFPKERAAVYFTNGITPHQWFTPRYLAERNVRLS